jgi:DNA (cytosine-5)-methyltransferase 1
VARELVVTESVGIGGPKLDRRRSVRQHTCIEICAGGGGQSLGLENAGFTHLAAVEIDPDACATLQYNRPQWKVLQRDIHHFNAYDYTGVDLLAGGVPCPPFSIAGKQLGADDERDLFPRALELIDQCKPTAVMLENVRGLATARFASYREHILNQLHEWKYKTRWQVLNASEYGVPQLRPRFILVAIKGGASEYFDWPKPVDEPRTVGATLRDAMASNGWQGADAWASEADCIGPTLVGGSRKHGGPDLGPTRARKAWLKLHVDGRGLADAPPSAEHPVDLPPRLTVQMTAALQGFPDDWTFQGRKTAAYRQVGNAFPPPVAEAVGKSIKTAIELAEREQPSQYERWLRAV